MTSLPTLPSLQLPKLPELPSFSAPELPTFDVPDLAPAPAPRLAGLPGTRERAKHVDAIVHANRAKTPPVAASQRTNPRLTIDELNQSDPDELRDRFLNTKYDTRTPVQQVLDLIDLPRNVIANIAFHDTAREQAGKGEYGSLGLPKVSVSDALRNSGVENRVALALGGFVGDVALDPLTYVGPAGWGAEIAGIGIRGAGKAALKKATKEAAEGGIHAVSDSVAKGVLKAAGVGEGPQAIQDVRKLVFGDARKGLGGKIESVLEPIGGERTYAGGVFEKFGKAGLTPENVADHENINAVKSFLENYARGTGGGIKIGRGGSEIAHLPGTDLTLQVPSFTTHAGQSLAILHAAREKNLANTFGKTESGADSAISAATPVYRSIVDDFLQGHDENAAAIGGLTGEAEHAATASAFATSMSDKADELARIVRDMPPEKIANLNANGVAQLGEMYDESLKMRDLAIARKNVALQTPGSEHLVDAYQDVVDSANAYRSLVGGTLKSHLDSKTIAASEQIKDMLGESDAQLGITLLGSLKGTMGNLFGHENPLVLKVDDLDRFVRNKFNVRSGEMPRKIADIKHRNDAESIAKLGEIQGKFHNDISNILTKYGIPADQMDNARALASIYHHQSVAKLNGKTLGESIFLNKVENKKLVRGDMIEKMNELMKSLRKSGAGREFHQELKAVADEGAMLTKKFRDSEMAVWQLGKPKDHYVPNMASVEQQLAMQGKRGHGLGWESKVGSSGPHPIQSHNIHRSTDVYQFQDELGDWYTFREMDRTRVARDLKKLARTDPKAAQELTDLKSIIEKYDALGDKAPLPRPDDFFSINKDAASGKLGSLSIDPSKDFFDTHLDLVLGRRAASHERSMANAEMVKIMSDAGIMSNEKLLSIIEKAGTSPKAHVLPGGQKVWVRTVDGAFGGKSAVLSGDGLSYRALSDGMAKFADHPMIGPIYNAGKDLILPEKVADYVEAFAEAHRDENLIQLMSALEKATAVFRTTTLFHPSWTIYDIVGGFSNAHAGGVNLGYMVDELKQAFKVKWAESHPEKVAELVVHLPTGDLHGEEALAYYKKAGALDRNFASRMGAAFTMNGATGLPSQFNQKGFIPDLKTDNAFNMARDQGWLGKPGAAAKSGLTLGWDRLNRHVFGPWVKTNAFVNDTMRIAAHNALLRQGNDAAGATDKMRRALFDYSDMSYFERKYMRNLFPFYSWMRNNLPYQMSQLFQQPKYAAMAPKLQRAIEDGIAGEQQVPMGLRPNWMRQSLATQVGANPDSRMAYMLGNSLPQTELYNILQSAMGWKGAQETLHYFGSSLNPVISAPLQLGGGQEYFSGRSIGADVGDGDISAGEFLTNLVRPINEAKKIANSKTVGEGVARGLIGGRLQDFSEARITSTRGRDLRDQAENIRRAVVVAESHGNKSDSLKARARLLRVYEEAMKLGLDKEVRVPAWAKRTLGMLASTLPEE